MLKMKFANLAGGATSRSIDGYSESFGNWKNSPYGSIADTWEQQALGLYAANYLTRLDTDVSVLQYPQKPIVRSFVMIL